MEDRIRAEWELQHLALGATAYKVVAVKKKGDKPVSYNFGKKVHNAKERTFSGIDVEGIISEIAQKNSEGFNIFITPVDRNYNFILVNRLKMSSYGRFIEKTKPCFSIKYDISNTQAVIKARKSDLDEESFHEASRLVNLWFGDESFSGCIRPIPMAGTVNYRSEKPFLVSTLESTPITSDQMKSVFAQGDLLNRPIRNAVAQMGALSELYAGAKERGAAMLFKDFSKAVDKLKTTDVKPLSQKYGPNEILKSEPIKSEKKGRTPKDPERAETLQKLKSIVEAARRVTLKSYLYDIEGANVKVKANLTKGVMSGLSYTIGNHKFTSEELGPDYAWPVLSKKVNFDRKVDFKYLLNRSDQIDGEIYKIRNEVNTEKPESRPKRT